VKDVFTLSGEDGTVVAGDVTVGTAAVKGDATDSADVVVGDIPFPDCHCVDAFDFDLHRLTSMMTSRRIWQCRSFEENAFLLGDGDSSPLRKKRDHGRFL